MKKISLFFCAMFIALSFSSCDEDLVVFDADGGQPLVTFASPNVNLPVVVDATGSVDVTVYVTTRSSEARTFNLTVDTDATTADAVTYSVPASVTVAANEFSGVFTITGEDIGVETTAKSIVINLTPNDGGKTITEGTLSVSIFQICPVTADFTGQYKVEIITPGVFGAGTFGADGTILDISVGAGGDLERTFEFEYFEDSRFVRDFVFTLVCNEIVVPYTDQLVGCGGNTVNLSTGPPTGAAGAFDGADDSSFIINITDNVDSDCGGGPVQASYKFVKVQ